MSCSGKTTLAARLADLLGADFVDLDAINWLPNWVGLNDTDQAELERRFRAATRGERWVTAGSYTATAQRAFWPRLDTIVWLDLPAPLLVWRCLRRSWQRWRSGELLWGTNVERFWPQLAVWRQQDSLVWWIATQHRRKRRNMLAATVDPRWSHVRFVRLLSSADVEAFVDGLPRQVGFGAAERSSPQRHSMALNTSPSTPTMASISCSEMTSAGPSAMVSAVVRSSTPRS